jgi:CheY-like chemotaxis protein
VFHFTGIFKVQDNAPTRTAAALQDVRGIRVLLVDDNRTNLRILEELLSHWHLRPTAVENGRQALAMMDWALKTGEPFHLALIDVNMPEMDGFELAERIKQTPQFKQTILLVLTSGGRPGDPERCRTLGVAGYLTKPVKQSELLKAILESVGVPGVSEGASKSKSECTTQEAASQNRARRPLRVLLAEDNAVNQELAVRLLEKMGHKVVLAENGTSAVNAFEREAFDVILMDVQMPEMDGLTAAATIREKEKKRGSHIPIVALTAHASREDRDRCLEAGMDAYLSKPINGKEFSQVIDRVSSACVDPKEETVEIGPGNGSTRNPAEGSLLDRAVVMDVVQGDVELLAGLLRRFGERCPQLLSEMRLAEAQRQNKAMEISAHSLKGMLGVFGARSASEKAFKLEMMGRKGDLTGARETLGDLEQEIEQLQPQLAALTGQPVGG